MTENLNKSIYSCRVVEVPEGTSYPLRYLIGRVQIKVKDKVLGVFDSFLPLGFEEYTKMEHERAERLLLEEARKALTLYRLTQHSQRLVDGVFEGLSIISIGQVRVDTPAHLEILRDEYGVSFRCKRLPEKSSGELTDTSALFPIVLKVDRKQEAPSFSDQYDKFLKSKLNTFGGALSADLPFRAEFVNNGPNTKEELEGKMPPEYYEGMPPDSAFHKRHINVKGKLGEFSKIEEEVDEMREALEQSNKPLVLIECFDLLGAIHHFLNKYNLTLEEAIPYVMQYDKFRESLKEKK